MPKNKPNSKFRRGLQRRPAIHIFCEGENTEPFYFKRYLKWAANGTNLVRFPKSKKNTSVCFEMWLLLHFEYTTAAYTDCADLLKRSNLKKRHIPGYDPKKDDFEYTGAQIMTARKNAARMNQAMQGATQSGHDAPHQINPFSNVYELLDSIDKVMGK